VLLSSVGINKTRNVFLFLKLTHAIQIPFVCIGIDLVYICTYRFIKYGVNIVGTMTYQFVSIFLA
jgi:hypothetical protein